MTTTALIDQQYKKLFLDFNFPAEKNYNLEDFKHSWVASAHAREFSASFGYPTRDFYQWVAAGNNEYQKDLALRLLHSSPEQIDEQTVRSFFPANDISILNWIIRIISTRSLGGCVDLLDTLRTHSDEDVRGNAIAAKALLVGPLPWQVDYESTKDASASVRLAAYERLAKNGQDIPMLVWLRAQEESDTDIKRLALAQLAKGSNAAIDAIMLEAIKDKDFVIAKVGREYLKRKPDHFFEHLSELLHESCAQTTIFSLDVLCQSKNPAVFQILVKTYESAKSKEVEKKVLVEMQKNKSDESTRFFLKNGQLKPIRKRKLYKFIDELVRLAVAQNFDALDLIVEHGKDKTKKALLDVVNNENSTSLFKYDAAKLYLAKSGDPTPEILALVLDGITAKNDFYFGASLNMMREYKLNQLSDGVRKYAAECTDNKKLISIKNVLDSIGEDHSTIVVEAKPIEQILREENEEAIVKALGSADTTLLKGHEDALRMLMYRNSPQIRVLARESLIKLDASRLQRQLKEEFQKHGAERLCKVIEHVIAIGVDDFLFYLRQCTYSDYPEVSASAVLALSKSNDKSIDIEKIKRNIHSSVLLKNDPNAAETLSEEDLLEMTSDDHCVSGSKAAKILLSRNTISQKDPGFAYLLMVAHDYDRILGCSIEQIHSALKRLIRYPFRVEFWRALSCLGRKGFDVQPICIDYLVHGFRYQQECASSILQKVENIDYHEILAIALDNIESMELSLSVLLAHPAKMHVQDLKRIYDAHFNQFCQMSDKENGIQFRRAESGMQKLLSVRQKIGCAGFLADAILFCEHKMTKYGYANSEVICSIGNDASSEAQLYLISLLRTSEVKRVSYALRNLIHSLKDPGNKIIVALFSNQPDKFSAIKEEACEISRETFDIIQRFLDVGSLRDTFLEMLKVLGGVIYSHALQDPSAIHPSIAVLFCDFFSQKAHPEAEDFLIYHLNHYGHGSQKRIYCIRGLGKIRCLSALHLIEPRIKSDDAVEQRAAIEALARIGNAGTVEQLRAIRPSLKKNLVDVCDKAVVQINNRLSST